MEILRLCFTIVDLIIFYVACTIFFKQRTINNNRVYIFITMLFISSMATIFYIDNLLLKYIILTLLISGMMKLLFDNNILSICLVVISVYGMFFMTDYAVASLIETEMPLTIFMESPINMLLAYSLSRLFVVIVVAVYSLKKSKLILESKYIYKFIFMSFLTISGLISLITPSKNIFIDNKYIIPFILVVNNLFIYYILSEFVKLSSKLKMKSIAEERARNELKLWQQLREKDVVQRKMMHDYSNTLICINGLLEKDDINATKQYVKNISAEYQLAKSFIATGNTLLDVLINTKYEKSLENSITMILKLDNLTDVSVQNEDLIVLISNLLDNAIEYCLELEKSKREIFFSIHKGKQLEIMVRNPLENEVIITDSLIESTKKDKENHGLGLVNIKEIVEKYQGEHYIDVDDGYFTYYIEI